MSFSSPEFSSPKVDIMQLYTDRIVLDVKTCQPWPDPNPSMHSAYIFTTLCTLALSYWEIK